MIESFFIVHLLFEICLMTIRKTLNILIGFSDFELKKEEKPESAPVPQEHQKPKREEWSPEAQARIQAENAEIQNDAQDAPQPQGAQQHEESGLLSPEEKEMNIEHLLQQWERMTGFQNELKHRAMQVNIASQQLMEQHTEMKQAQMNIIVFRLANMEQAALGPVLFFFTFLNFIFLKLC